MYPPDFYIVHVLKRDFRFVVPLQLGLGALWLINLTLIESAFEVLGNKTIASYLVYVLK